MSVGVDRDGAAPLHAYAAFAAAGFRRFAAYRQAMLAAVFTNSMFGFLRCSVLLALAGHGAISGYDDAQLATFVWVGQGLIGVVLLWAPTELADRIRTGHVVADLLRPVDLVWQLLAADLGRAGFAVLTRLVGPVVVGALAFRLYAPSRPATYALFALSMLLATIVCFGCRFLVNAASYWLLDARGPQVAWTLLSAVLGGLYFPLWFLPRAGALALILGTPFPSIMQLPLDVLVERGPLSAQLVMIAVQIAWAANILALCRWVQRRGELKLVVQGG